MEFTIANSKINYELLYRLIGKPSNTYDIQYQILVQKRRHRKKRINKKWAKRYGYTERIKTLSDCKMRSNTDGCVEFVCNKFGVTKL